MKIAFLTSGLEPGKDGVGDYTRSLAGECAKGGHEVFLLGLNDRLLDAAEEEAFPRCLRLPAAKAWAERLSQAKAFLDACQPEWVSLQFVPYGFHDKGLPCNMAAHLRQLVEGRKIHVMFHELWIGGFQNAKLKERLVGALQRACLFRMLRSLGPNKISTSIAPYMELLKAKGFDAELLPIFGSIPFGSDANVEWVNDEIGRSGVPARRRDERWVFCLFGSLHSIWPSEPLFRYLREAGERSARQIIIMAVGRLGPGEQLWEKLKFQSAEGLHFVHLGQRSTTEVSAALQASDFGLATSPWELIGKSSSVSAMLEHGLPVIVNRDDVRFGAMADTRATDPLLVKMDAHLPARLATLRKRPPQEGLPGVARKFLQLLSSK